MSLWYTVLHTAIRASLALARSNDMTAKYSAESGAHSEAGIRTAPSQREDTQS